MLISKRVLFVILVIIVRAADGRADDKSADAYFRDGKKLQQAKKWSEAEEAFTQAMEMEPKNPSYINGRALLFMDVGDALLKAGKADQAHAVYLKALDDLKAAVELDPTFARAWNNAGVISNRIGDNRMAIDFYTHAIDCDPQNAVAYRNRGKTWLKLGNKAKAAADIQRADELEGNSQENAKPAKILLPEHYDRLGLTDEQKDKVSKTVQDHDAKVVELKQKMANAGKVPGGASIVIAAANAIKKLNIQREQTLEEILTEEQRSKLQKLRSQK